MEPSWLKFVILFGIMQSVLVIYLLRSSRKGIAHAILISILAILLIAQIEAFLIRLDQFSWFVHLMNISAPMIFLLGPLLYFYIRYQLGKSELYFKDGLHALPFLFYWFYSFNFYLQPHALKYNAAVMGFHPELDLIPVVQSFPFDPWNIQGIIIVELLSLHLIIYCLISFLVIFKSKVNQSKTSSKKEWLYYVSGIMTAGALIMFFSQGGVINGKVFLKSPFPHYSADISSTIAMYALMIYFLVRPEIYKTIKTNKYEKSSLPSAYKKEKLKQLKALIETEKLFLDPGFSMKSLSQKSGLSSHHISQILNEELGLNFFELTNDYRITEAKSRLRNSEEYIKMEQLAYELGYKSKSTFFTAFKKSTNQTPLKYKKSIS
ncbi:MAG: AraC family transcriptional regulator [Bacteroidia bacterium]|nr:AraC family transcriptional regulator [Bacteroidia bacterium]MBT8268402.1 AraC family transcriptional regulator [Bacteroidia bacterium]